MSSETNRDECILHNEIDLNLLESEVEYYDLDLLCASKVINLGLSENSWITVSLFLSVD